MLSEPEVGEVIAIDDGSTIDPKKVGRTARGAPVVGAGAISPRDDAMVVVAVGDVGARDVVRGRLVARGFVEGRLRRATPRRDQSLSLYLRAW